MPRQIKLFTVVTLISILLLAMPHITRSADPLPKVDLVMWHLQGSADGVQALFTDWANTNAPGSTLTLIPKQVDDLQADFLAAGSSDKPDLLWTVADHTASFVAAGLLQPVDGLVDASLMLPAVTQSTAIQGKTYGVPMQAGNELMLFYNKKFVLQAPKTFDDLVKIAGQLQAANPDPTKFIPLVYNQREALWVFPIANAFGATLFAADGKTPTLDTPAWTKTYQLIYDLQFKDKIQSTTDCNSYQCTDQRFKDGTAAMIFNGDWALDGDTGYIKILGDQLGIAPYPAIDSSLKNIPASFIVGQYVMIPAATQGDHLKTAEAFLQYLATDKAAVLARTVAYRRLPVLLSALQDSTITSDPVLSQASQILMTGVSLPVQPQMDCVIRALQTKIRLLGNDSIKPSETGAAVQQMAVDCLTPPTPTK